MWFWSAKVTGHITQKQRGFATLEVAAWSTIIIPIALSFFAVFGLVRDQQVVRLIPESLARESVGRSLVWESNSIDGILRIEDGRLDWLMENLALRALTQLELESARLRNVSSRVCYWVYNVDPNTGAIGTVALQNCMGRGDMANSLSLEGALNRRLMDGIARPINPGDVGGGFFPRTTLIGVAVGGRFDGLAELFRDEAVEHATVWIPREELVI